MSDVVRLKRPFGFDGDVFAPVRFVAYFWFVGWWALSFGAHISLRDPNIEIHVPFGFIRIGFIRRTT